MMYAVHYEQLCPEEIAEQLGKKSLSLRRNSSVKLGRCVFYHVFGAWNGHRAFSFVF